jgi:hypothetical protein
MSPLDSLRVASPCSANWDAMEGDDDRVRYCGKCEKNVYNLSAMPRAEAEELLRLHEGNLCARMYQRADGTLISTDCPVGARTKRVRHAAVAAVGGGLLAASLLVMSRRSQAMTSALPGLVRKPLTELHLVSEMNAVQTTKSAEPTEPEISLPVMGSVAPPLPPPPPKPEHVMGRIGRTPARANAQASALAQRDLLDSH